MILTINTISGQCDIALIDGAGHILLKQEERMAKGQGEAIIDMLNTLFAEAKAKHKIKAIAVNQGPGSFTGIRVGISVAEGLRLALPSQTPINMIGLNAIEAYLFAFKAQLNKGKIHELGEGRILTLIDNGRQDFFVHLAKIGDVFDGNEFDNDKRQTLSFNELVTSIKQDICPPFLIGSAAPRFDEMIKAHEDELAPSYHYQDEWAHLPIELLSKMAFDKYKQALANNLSFSPLKADYARAADVKLPTKNTHFIPTS